MFIDVTNLYKYNVMLTNHLSQIFHVKSIETPSIQYRGHRSNDSNIEHAFKNNLNNTIY